MRRLNFLKRVAFVGGLLVFGAFAYITAVRLAYTMIYACVLLVGGAWLASRLAGGRLRLERTGESGAYQVGERIRENFTLRNPGWLGLAWVEAVDRADIPGYDPGRVVTVARRGSRSWTAEGILTARGRYLLGPMEVVSGDALGMFRHARRFPGEAAITVYPRLVDVAALVPEAGLTLGDAVVAGRHIDLPPDTYGIREYDPSDGYNRIHWPSTARLGRPMSRSFEKLEGSELLLVLDLQRGNHRGHGEVSTLEYAMSLAASITVAALASGQNVALLGNDAAETVIPAGRGGHQLRRVLDFLAVGAADGERPLEQLLRRIALGAGQQSIVLITPRAEGEWVDRVVALGRGAGAQATVLQLDGESFTPGRSARDAAPRARLVGERLRWHTIGAGHPAFRGELEEVRLPMGMAEAVA